MENTTDGVIMPPGVLMVETYYQNRVDKKINLS